MATEIQANTVPDTFVWFTKDNVHTKKLRKKDLKNKTYLKCADIRRKALKRRRCVRLPSMTPDPPVDWCSETRPSFENVVATANLGVSLDLKRVCLHAPNTEHNPQKFAAVTMRIMYVTALIFSSGRMVVPGARSFEESLYFAQIFRLVLEDVKHVVIDPQTGDPYLDTLKGQITFNSFEIQNIVARGELEQFSVNLRRVKDKHAFDMVWVPDVFPGMKYVMNDPKDLTALLFDTSRVVIMGRPGKKENVYLAFRNCKQLVSDYNDPNAPTDPRERYQYRINMLLKSGADIVDGRVEPYSTNTKDNAASTNKRKRKDEQEASSNKRRKTSSSSNSKSKTSVIGSTPVAKDVDSDEDSDNADDEEEDIYGLNGLMDIGAVLGEDLWGPADVIS